ncbi:carboxylesterase type B [Terriglobus roseus DSM 18391]|uniref:Carboxylesterase type B n=2 Tax=Terriglobus roseus TaxID=392734 RepID=I3ZM80_TERRK|nr:carboxylesterase type B [Terriglobus roseus DSM 18391]
MTLAASALHAQDRGGNARADRAEGRHRSDGTVEHLGIPYAQPPVGPLRFRAPVPVRKRAPALGHLPSPAMQPGREGVSEDCLYLNVYAPNPNTPGAETFPVFVWIHGGGFTGGSPNDFDGGVFAKQGIVVVTVAYRLGVFGFLDWSPLLGAEYADSANNALRDLVCALQWVKKHVGAYGGDPSRVTIGGESAGAKLVGSLMGIEEAKPLFQSMISESGGGERILEPTAAPHVTDAFAAQLKDRTPAGIQAASGESLIAAQLAMTDVWPANFPLRAEAGGALLPHRSVPAIAAGNTRGKRLLIGTNRDENALYLGKHAAEPITQKRLGNTTEAQFNAILASYRKIYPDMSPADINIRALTAEEYWVPSIRVAQAHAKGGGSTWFYRLDETAVAGPHKGESYHSYDLGFVWQKLSAEEPPAAQNLSRQMHDAWVTFIQGRAPAATGLPAWPKWTPEKRSTMLFNGTSTVEQRPFEAELRLWDGIRFD